MIGQNNYMQSLIKLAEGKIQSKVSKFLALKEPLNKMTYYPSSAISNRAKELLDKQVLLENEMKRGLAIIDDMKATGFDIGKSLEVTNIAQRIDLHMKESKIFLEGAPEAKPSIVSKVARFSSPMYFALGVVGVLGLFYIFGGKR